MNWFDKIKKLTTSQDKSALLKKGDIKQILITTANEILLDFDFIAYKDNCYTFQRIRHADKLIIYEMIYIIYTLKDGNFSCSIASILNPEYIFKHPFNNGLLNPHTDLKGLKHNSIRLNIEDSYYFHNGQIETTTNTVKEIFRDYKIYGLQFLNKQLERLESNSIVKHGFDYIENLYTDKNMLKNEITEELNKCGFVISRIKHPKYIELKEKLQSVSGQSKEDRQFIPKTAFELLEIYWTR